MIKKENHKNIKVFLTKYFNCIRQKWFLLVVYDSILTKIAFLFIKKEKKCSSIVLETFLYFFVFLWNLQKVCKIS